MKRTLRGMMVAVALLFTTIAQAQLVDVAPESGLTTLYKPGETGPEVWVFNPVSSPAMNVAESEALKQRVLEKMYEDGWTVIPQGFDTESARLDARTRCDIAIAVYGQTEPSAVTDVTCGPANTYGDGLFVRRSLNSMTTRGQAFEEALYAGEYVRRVYERAVAIRIFETAFASR